MTARDVQIEILDPMQRIFIAPRPNMAPGDVDAALRDYVSTLEQFAAPDLAQAWAKIKETHIRVDWPKPGAFFKAAKDARKDRNEAVAGSGRSRHRDLSPEDLWQLWKTVAKTELAREAVRGGVAWPLKHAILYDRKLPDQIDLQEFITAKARAERTHKAIEEGKRVEFKGKLLPEFCGRTRARPLSMYRQLQSHEMRTAAEINSGVGDRDE